MDRIGKLIVGGAPTISPPPDDITDYPSLTKIQKQKHQPPNKVNGKAFYSWPLQVEWVPLWAWYRLRLVFTWALEILGNITSSFALIIIPCFAAIPPACVGQPKNLTVSHSKWHHTNIDMSTVCRRLYLWPASRTTLLHKKQLQLQQKVKFIAQR